METTVNCYQVTYIRIYNAFNALFLFKIVSAIFNKTHDNWSFKMGKQSRAEQKQTFSGHNFDNLMKAENVSYKGKCKI